MKTNLLRSQIVRPLILLFCAALCVVAGCKGIFLYVSKGDFYQPGALAVQVISLDAGGELQTPVQMDIYTPTALFRYPVIIFQHGFTGSIKQYETILNHLASHGFVVVAPQMYPPGGEMGGTYPTPEEEAALGVQIISWVQENIKNIVPVNADAKLLGIAGHSRGGQTAYRMAILVPDKVKALSGVDPVDGLVIFGQELAITGPLMFNIPTYVLGTGLGTIPVTGGAIELACAPADIGYRHFFDADPSPSWLAVATENGHTDMIDEADLCPNGVCSSFCPGGPNRDGMRAFTAGTLAAFFSGTLQGNRQALTVLTDQDDAPVPCTMEKK